MPAADAIVNNPVLVDSNPAVNSRHQKFAAVLAEFFLKLRRKPYLILHGNFSCQIDIFVRKPAVFLENLLCFAEKKADSSFCNLLL